MATVAGVWRRRDETLWRRSIDAVVLLAPGADEPVVLPGTAAAVWDLLAEPASLDALVAALSTAYAGGRAAIAPDVADLLRRLEALGAVEVVEAA